MLGFTGHDQISNSGKTCKCLKLTAHRSSKTDDFRYTTCDDRSLCIVTTAKSIADTCRK